MFIPFLAAALALQAAPAQTITEPVAIAQENRAVLRCSAAFAMIANRQAQGEADARQWPDLGTRGREFFVRAMAQLMDATGLDRAGIAQLAGAEAKALSAKGAADKIMPSCLLMLEGSGL